MTTMLDGAIGSDADCVLPVAPVRLAERSALNHLLDRLDGRRDVGTVVLVEQQPPNLAEFVGRQLHVTWLRVTHRQDATS